ncbi:aspartate kinase [Chryseolinea sp. T2]|uniref:aspartate kinase n=1 Tax=Chryseolinea sp. T2 TaxID=3129255 RepID=UPI0030779CAC
MRVFKFGGASLKSPEGIRNVVSIVLAAPKQLLVVVSAMGKTTDMLERICHLAATKQDYSGTLESLVKYHTDTVVSLFPDPNEVIQEISRSIDKMVGELGKAGDTDQIYDQVVCYGEILSSIIVFHYLKSRHAATEWIDARDYVATDSTFREGKVDWKKTSSKIATLRAKMESNVIITQGFIGRTPGGLTTTLGREGSDYTAAIFTSSLGAESLTIWKDVAGVMNADPRKYPNPIIFEELPYKEAAEMTYYGASVIHPKTIKPLANKLIPLFVKNFEDPSLPGTKIHECVVERLPPLIVWKENQCLISCKVTDYTFISEDQLREIFATLMDLDIRINVMQNSAISFSFCIDFRESKLTRLIARLQPSFEVYYNMGLTLITVKNYDTQTFEKFRKLPGVLLEQSSRSTLQVLVRKS